MKKFINALWGVIVYGVLVVALPWAMAYYSNIYLPKVVAQFIMAFVIFGWIYFICEFCTEYYDKIYSDKNVLANYEEKRRDRILTNVILYGAGFLALLLVVCGTIIAVVEVGGIAILFMEVLLFSSWKFWLVATALISFSFLFDYTSRKGEEEALSQHS